MDLAEWLDSWLSTKQARPRTIEKYSRAVGALKQTLEFTDLSEITAELTEKTTKEDPVLRSVLSMALAQAVKANLLKSNVAAVRREQRKPQEGSLYYRPNRRAWVAQATLMDQSGKQIKKTRLIKVDRKTRNPPEAAVRALEELKALKAGGWAHQGNITRQRAYDRVAGKRTGEEREPNQRHGGANFRAVFKHLSDSHHS